MLPQAVVYSLGIYPCLIRKMIHRKNKESRRKRWLVRPRSSVEGAEIVQRRPLDCVADATCVLRRCEGGSLYCAKARAGNKLLCNQKIKKKTRRGARGKGGRTRRESRRIAADRLFRVGFDAQVPLWAGPSSVGASVQSHAHETLVEWGSSSLSKKYRLLDGVPIVQSGKSIGIVKKGSLINVGDGTEENPLRQIQSALYYHLADPGEGHVWRGVASGEGMSVVRDQAERTIEGSVPVASKGKIKFCPYCDTTSAIRHDTGCRGTGHDVHRGKAPSNNRRKKR